MTAQTAINVNPMGSRLLIFEVFRVKSRYKIYTTKTAISPMGINGYVIFWYECLGCQDKETFRDNNPTLLNNAADKRRSWHLPPVSCAHESFLCDFQLPFLQ